MPRRSNNNRRGRPPVDVNNDRGAQGGGQQAGPPRPLLPSDVGTGGNEENVMVRQESQQAQHGPRGPQVSSTGEQLRHPLGEVINSGTTSRASPCPSPGWALSAPTVDRPGNNFEVYSDENPPSQQQAEEGASSRNFTPEGATSGNIARALRDTETAPQDGGNRPRQTAALPVDAGRSASDSVNRNNARDPSPDRRFSSGSIPRPIPDVEGAPANRGRQTALNVSRVPGQASTSAVVGSFAQLTVYEGPSRAFSVPEDGRGGQPAPGADSNSTVIRRSAFAVFYNEGSSGTVRRPGLPSIPEPGNAPGTGLPGGGGPTPAQSMTSTFQQMPGQNGLANQRFTPGRNGFASGRMQSGLPPRFGPPGSGPRGSGPPGFGHGAGRGAGGGFPFRPGQHNFTPGPPGRYPTGPGQYPFPPGPPGRYPTAPTRYNFNLGPSGGYPTESARYNFDLGPPGGYPIGPSYEFYTNGPTLTQRPSYSAVYGSGTAQEAPSGNQHQGPPGPRDPRGPSGPGFRGPGNAQRRPTPAVVPDFTSVESFPPLGQSGQRSPAPAASSSGTAVAGPSGTQGQRRSNSESSGPPPHLTLRAKYMIPGPGFDPKSRDGQRRIAYIRDSLCLRHVSLEQLQAFLAEHTELVRLLASQTVPMLAPAGSETHTVDPRTVEGQARLFAAIREVDWNDPVIFQTMQAALTPEQRTEALRPKRGKKGKGKMTDSPK